MKTTVTRRLPIGAELRPGGGVHLRVWAPDRQRIEVVPDDAPETAVRLKPEPGGYHAGLVPGLKDGDLYRLRLDDDPKLYPDPASRFQPEGPHGPSQVVDPSRFRWTDDGWAGVGPEGQVLYELHVGCFTPAGTWAAAAERLPDLVRLGITVLEVMPVAEFCGAFGWGYDGVNLFAPTRLYGSPDDFRRFVDRAHGLGLGVILDVVYNHLGPDGNYLAQFAKCYFSDRYENEWGDPLNFDGPGSAGVREHFLANARYWIEEFHLDGMRLDATQQMFDASEPHIVAEIADAVRAAAGRRRTLMVAENEPQDRRQLLPRSEGGHGLDMVWNDDWHRSAVVALTGRREAYFTDHLGKPQEFVSAAKRGFVYQGQHYSWQGKPRGTPTKGLPPWAFVAFAQNHDQIANTPFGRRLQQLTSPGRYRALSALLLLGPQTPMLFMGQEFAASSPFHYFADHKPDLARQVRRGRADFLAQFPNLAEPTMRRLLPDPADPDTFDACKLDWCEREHHHETLALYEDLLQRRRDDPVFARPRPGGVDGAVLGPAAFVLRYFGEAHGDRLLLVNLGLDLHLPVLPEPLLAPPQGCRWNAVWNSEHPRYGGIGMGPLVRAGGEWHITGEAALVLESVPEDERG